MTKPEQKKIAITHASSLLGEALLEFMAAAGVDPEHVILLDRQELAGNRLSFGSTYLDVQDQLEYDYENLAAVLLLEADDELADLLLHADCPVISHLHDSNQHTVFNPLAKGAKLPESASAIRLPSATLSTLLAVIEPIHQQVCLQSLNVVNILSASFAGKAGVEELAGQTIALLNSQTVKPSVFPMQLAFNMFAPEVTEDQEQQIVDALQAESLKCSVQNLQVASFHGLVMAVTLESQKRVDLPALAAQLNHLPGVKIDEHIVSPQTHCLETSEILINQLSQPQNDSNRLQFWIFADAAKNGLLKNYLLTIEILLKSFL